ncbi:TNF receptor-associated factor 3-like [Saccostrea echinata]|uniref:TNF receptor-associated factor 3-like n=1 Tax=Saccostrea echinata TaxID=191078 RepID=UPI002A7F7AD2|nr:TNF receptor-associated factor 3-like [Saccostrea echinata]
MLTPQITPPNSLSSQTPPGHPEFVKIDEKYMCILCNNVLNDAVQTLCGHRLCQACSDNYLQGGGNRQCPYQEEMCEMLQKEGIIPDTSARREIRQLKVYCPNKLRGCHKIVKWKELEKHIEECPHEPLSCPYKDWGCQEMVERMSLPDHQLVCPFIPIQCEHCGQTIPKESLPEHEKENCMKIPINCEYGCNTGPFPRDQILQHQEICPKKPRICKYASAGCTFQGLAEEVEEHERQNQDVHLQQVTLQMAKIDLHSIDIRRELQEMERIRQEAQKQVSEARKEIEELRQLADDIRRHSRKFKIDVVELTERIIHAEKQVEELAQPESYKRTISDVNILRENIRSLKDRANELLTLHSSEQGGASATATPASSDPYTDVQQQTRSLGLQDARLAELDLRFQILETINYEGVLFWKITNYRRRKQEAVSGKTLSIYSSPFFTNRYGYKMCARVYLNGDGMGKGTHFSIFFVVMQGEYDALLPWPFRQKVTFQIIDQSGSRRHLSDSFKPDPSSSSFKRPLAEMNIASGCPLFVSHSILETSGNYIREDTLFVKVIVDTNGLVPI